MKINFITGKFKPGHCGISDYVSILSDELKSSGHSCRITSVDPQGRNSFSSIADNLPECDFIVILFAPYAFSPNGVSGNDLKVFGKKLKSRQTQVIFHEIWIGEYGGAGIIQKFRGLRQKREIIDFIQEIKPGKIYATNAASLYRLGKSGISTSYLYLFGNIPFDKDGWNSTEIDSSQLVFIFFGTLYESFPYERAIAGLRKIAEKSERKLKLRVIGRQREQKGIQRLRNLFTGKENILEELGEVSKEKASHHLQIADFGIATTPFDALGKSGTVAAMLEHGLHVIAFDDKDTPRIETYVSGPIVDQVILLNDQNIDEKVLAVLQKGKEKPYRGVLKTSTTLIQSFR